MPSMLLSATWPKLILVQIAICCLVTLPAISLAQRNNPDTATAARPKATNDGHFTLKHRSTQRDNEREIYLARYLQEGHDFTDKDAYIFYQPFAFLVADVNGNIRYNIDEEDKLLTLYIRWLTPNEYVEREFRTQAIIAAKQRDESFNLEEGTNAYHITPLQPTRIWLEFGKPRSVTKRLKSQILHSSLLETGEVHAYFPFDDLQHVRRSIAQLHQGEDGSPPSEQLTLYYTFDGIYDHVCEGTINHTSVEGIDLYKDLVGSGKTAVVTRKQAVNVAQKMVDSQVIEARCASASNTQEMINTLMELAGSMTKQGLINGWEELNKLVTLDINDFKADVITKIKEIKNTVDRNQLQDAWTKSVSESEAQSKAGGVKGGYGPFSAEVSASFTERSAEAGAEAKRIYAESLRKQGVYGEFEGTKYVPKSVDVHTTASLKRAWAQSREIEIKVKGAREVKRFHALTAASYTNAMPAADWREVEGQITRQIAEQSQRVTSIVARVDAVDADVNKLTKLTNRLSRRTRRQSGVLKEVGSILDNLNRDLKQSISLEICLYTLHKGDAYETKFRTTTRRTDKVAFIGGFSTECTTRGNDDLRISMARRGGGGSKSSDWQLFVKDWYRCDWIQVQVGFINGKNVKRSGINAYENFKTYKRLNQVDRSC